MTRLELLFSYPLYRRRDAWISMGGGQIDFTNRIFTKNSMFRLVASGAPLNGAILFVMEDFTAPTEFDWANYNLDNITTGTIIDNISIIHPNLRVVVTAGQYTAIVEDYDPDFIPFANADPIDISDDDLAMILRDVGVPFIQIDELEFNREQILKYVVRPAMLEYFKWYPIITIEHYPMTMNTFSIPIPAYADTAIRAYVNPGYPVNSTNGNPMLRYFDEQLMSISPRGSFATPNINSRRRQGFVDTQSYTTYIMERAARQGIINYASRTRIRINVQQGMVKGYSTKMGMVEIEWAQHSNYWSDIPFNRQSEVRELATSYAMRSLGMLRGQLKTDLPGQLNYDYFIQRADKLEEKVTKLWQDSTKGIIVRS